jgi:hypothetical protein
MARRQVAIDWDDLEIAFVSRMDDWAPYLDLRTGKVHAVPTSGLHDDVPGGVEGILSNEAIDTGLAEGWLLPIEPVESSEEYDWMVQFAGTIADPRLRELLEVALGGHGAFRRFKDVLARSPKERARWFAFPDECLRNAMLDWLTAHEIEPTAAPPPRRAR